MAITITVFAGSDTPASYKVLNNGLPVDLSDVTRITVAFGNIVIDSEIETEAFEWINTEKMGEIYMTLGPYLTDKNCKALPARLTLFDLAHPNGVVMDTSCDDPSFYIKVC